jgi:hypothetical protein
VHNTPLISRGPGTYVCRNIIDTPTRKPSPTLYPLSSLLTRPEPLWILNLPGAVPNTMKEYASPFSSPSSPRPAASRRMHITPRLRYILGLVLAPAAIYLLSHATSATSSDLESTRLSIHHPAGEKPDFHPFIEGAEDGYNLHLIGEDLDVAPDPDRWGLGKLGISRLTGKQRPSILITGGAGQLGTFYSTTQVAILTPQDKLFCPFLPTTTRFTSSTYHRDQPRYRSTT